MAKTILASGDTASVGEQPKAHMMIGAKALGSGQTVVVEMADTKDATTPNDMSTIPDSAWMATDVEIDDTTQIKPVFTSPEFAVRVRVEGSGTPACVVAAGYINEPSNLSVNPLDQEI